MREEEIYLAFISLVSLSSVPSKIPVLAWNFQRTEYTLTYFSIIYRTLYTSLILLPLTSFFFLFQA